jgi:GNAT superfamily N-acetyltransferase
MTTMSRKMKFVVEQFGRAFSVIAMDCKASVGRVAAMEIETSQGRVMQVRAARVVPGAQRKGVGTKLYERAAQIACRDFGAPLASDSDRTAAAEGFWRKQVTKRRARAVDDIYVLNCPVPKSLKGARRR